MLHSLNRYFVNAHESFKVQEKEGCEIAGSIQEMILSQALQRCLLRLRSCVLNRSCSFFASGGISNSHSNAECLKA